MEDEELEEDQVDDQVSNYTQSTTSSSIHDSSKILEMMEVIAPDSKFDFTDDSMDEKQSDASLPDTSSNSASMSVSAKPIKVIKLNIMRELTHQNANE